MAGFSGAWSASAGTVAAVGVIGGSKVSATVTCTAGGAATIVCPLIDGKLSRVELKPDGTTPNATTNWSVAITDTVSGAALGTIQSLASPPSATTAESQHWALPIPCRGTLTFTFANFTASTAHTLTLYTE